MTAHNPIIPQTSLLSRGMLAVMLAKFLSSLADNAPLFAVIAMMKPAKYGILSELVAVEKLVKTNSLMEGSTIVAILLGQW